jgi:hypothetical protein
MYIESLVKLAEIYSIYEDRKEKIVDENFHDEVKQLIEEQTKFLKNELEMKLRNPGPYVFGIGDEFTLTIFTPEHTETAEWAAIVRSKTSEGECTKNYRFNSMQGLINCLIKAFEEYSITQTEKKKSN